MKEITDIQYIHGVAFPADVKFRQLLITGAPGSGKTTIINKIGGWSEEGYIDLSLNNWWKSRVLAMRPREVHLGLPFCGVHDSLAVFDKQWITNMDQLQLNCEAIAIPPCKRYFFSIDWRAKYAFEFLLPPAQDVFVLRKQRARAGSHPVDCGVTMQLVEQQLIVFQQAAKYLHASGVNVYIRDQFDGLPKRIID